jgi:nicotinate-nucleotide--dimethylbenzimidazole phosphoribosyltransferase
MDVQATRAIPRTIIDAIAAVDIPDPSWSVRAAEHQGHLTMPSGSLGRLLELGQQLAAIQGTIAPRTAPALVAVFAADHGVARSGVSAYPQEVTGQMVKNFADGGAAICVLTRTVGADLKVVDLGVAHPPALLENQDRVSSRPLRRGTSNFLEGPAMSRDEAFRAVEEGLQLGSEWNRTHGYRVVALGEMGIGNTTAAAALTAALTGSFAGAVVGRGTGVDDHGLRRKSDAVDYALRLHGPNCRDTWDWLAAVGGFEILGLAGLAIAAAGAKALVVLDGFISSVAGLIAERICPAIHGYFVAAHIGPEPGHKIVLDALRVRPLLQLELRLGEGTGAVLALPLIAGAANILNEMATFESASVSGPNAT